MFAEKFDAFGGCLRARNRSVIRHLVIQRAAPDKVGSGVGMGVGRSVDDHGDCAFFDGVGDMRAALLNLVNHFRRNPPRLEIGCGAASGDDLKTRPMKSLGDSINTIFVFVPNADENFTLRSEWASVGVLMTMAIAPSLMVSAICGLPS